MSRFRVIEGGGEGDDPSGGGPEDPMFEQRVARLEEDVKELRGDVRVIRDDIADIKERFARMEGGFAGINAKLDAIPTVWNFSQALIIQFIAIIGVVVGILALLKS
jgi:hypothetical protein